MFAWRIGSGGDCGLSDFVSGGGCNIPHAIGFVFLLLGMALVTWPMSELVSTILTGEPLGLSVRQTSARTFNFGRL